MLFRVFPRQRSGHRKPGQGARRSAPGRSLPQPALGWTQQAACRAARPPGRPSSQPSGCRPCTRALQPLTLLSPPQKRPSSTHSCPSPALQLQGKSLHTLQPNPVPGVVVLTLPQVQVRWTHTDFACRICIMCTPSALHRKVGTKPNDVLIAPSVELLSRCVFGCRPKPVVKLKQPPAAAKSSSPAAALNAAWANFPMPTDFMSEDFGSLPQGMDWLNSADLAVSPYCFSPLALAHIPLAPGLQISGISTEIPKQAATRPYFAGHHSALQC